MIPNIFYYSHYFSMIIKKNKMSIHNKIVIGSKTIEVLV